MRSSDWSSDVCSSDLKEKGNAARYHFGARAQRVWSIFAEEGLVGAIKKSGPGAAPFAFLCYDKWKDKKEPEMVDRSEERRVRKECVRTCSSWWAANHSKQRSVYNNKINIITIT